MKFIFNIALVAVVGTFLSNGVSASAGPKAGATGQTEVIPLLQERISLGAEHDVTSDWVKARLNRYLKKKGKNLDDQDVLHAMWINLDKEIELIRPAIKQGQVKKAEDMAKERTNFGYTPQFMNFMHDDHDFYFDDSVFVLREGKDTPANQYMLGQIEELMKPPLFVKPGHFSNRNSADDLIKAMTDCFNGTARFLLIQAGVGPNWEHMGTYHSLFDLNELYP